MNLLVVNRKVYKDGGWSFGNSLVFRYLAYWPLFLCLTFLALAGSWAYLNFTDPVCNIRTKILIKGGGNGLEDGNALNSLGSAMLKENIANEIQASQTQKLLNTVVKNLNLYAPVFLEEGFKGVSAYQNSPIIIVADNNNIKETGKVYFTVDKNSIHLDKFTYPLNKLVSTPYGKLEFKKNVHFERQTDNKFYFKLLAPEKVASSIASKLMVTADKQIPGFVAVNYTDEVSLRGEDIVNEFIKAFNQVIIDKQNKLTSNTAKVIDEHIASVENDLLSIENKLLYARLPEGTTPVGGKEKKVLENVNTNNGKANQINAKINVLNRVRSDAETKDLSGLTIPLTVKLAMPDLTQMAVKIKHLQTEAERVKKTGGESSPIYVACQSNIEKIRFQLLKRLHGQISVLQADRNNLLQKNNSYLSALVTGLEKPQQLLSIQKEQAVKKQEYVFLLKQKEEIAVASVANATDSKIIESVKSYPVNHNQQLIYLSAVFTALITGFGVVTKKETLRSRVMFQKDIEQVTKLPVIGGIAAEKTIKGLWLRNNKKALITGQFRKLRASLNYLIMDTRQKRILVTSAVAGEGKSFVAQHLALSQAQTGKKVALLSIAFKQPVAASTMPDGLDRFEVMAYLPGTTGNEKIIWPVTIEKSNFLIADGELPENSSGLLKDIKIAELLNYLDEQFDCTIIDTATSDTIADAYALSALCDATLYIIRQGHTPKALIKGLDKEKLYNAAIVFNGLNGINISSN
ncbi:polysaccharide biosynthesis tyrosine autokinase [Mucilaginibacter arboris]|uniref:Uncharacterized protein n=1 Tax=Mucilaginibacter arboris TaxID=2682090 RepID=A0A7K1SVT9_9SPHI|nr:tyrosine-protein kinase domain-containing protein [Mucilaginibacter arboris]MVN21435.1 hypothetical protein [Mucilaginibacter arboris]